MLVPTLTFIRCGSACQPYRAHGLHRSWSSEKVTDCVTCIKLASHWLQNKALDRPTDKSQRCHNFCNRYQGFGLCHSVHHRTQKEHFCKSLLFPVLNSLIKCKIMDVPCSPMDVLIQTIVFSTTSCRAGEPGGLHGGTCSVDCFGVPYDSTEEAILQSR